MNQPTVGMRVKMSPAPKDPRAELRLEDIVPGGFKDGDHIHVETNDNTCSRCRQAVREDEVPLLMWLPPEGTRMLIYCGACSEGPQQVVARD